MTKYEEFIVEKGLFITAILSIIIIVLIIGFIFQQGFPAMEQIGILKFTFGMKWSPSDD